MQTRSDEPFEGAIGVAELGRMRALGIEWIAFSCDLWLDEVDRPRVRRDTPDDEIRARIRLFRAHGFRVFFLPRLECESFYREKNPTWRGDIAMKNPDDWARFHQELERETVRYAKLAGEEGVELFGVGLEYRQSAGVFEWEWRHLIAAVREVYRGKVTYSANWYKEYEEVRFWDALDYVGIGSYFPLTDKKDEKSAAAIAAGWARVKENLERVAVEYERPVLFTEVGYPTYADAAFRPWEWTTTKDKVISPADQAACYRALYDHLDGDPWFAGMFIWRFYTQRATVRPWDYSPQGKEAEQVIGEHWRRFAPGPLSAPTPK